MVVNIKPADGLSEQIEMLRAQVLTSLGERAQDGYALAFASCGAHEGVTGVSMNFAASLADGGGQRVIVMDGNLQSPELQKWFGKEQLEKTETIRAGTEEAATPLWRNYRVNLNLDVLFARKVNFSPARVFETEAFKNNLQQLREKYDCIVIDCPALNKTSGAIALASRADAVVLVVEAERIRREVIQRTIAVLEDGGANILGVVLNKRRYPIPGVIYKML